MKDNTNFDVIIIGGSYAGLSAAMALGRALRQVLVIDSGKPCNRQTPHSHNFITQDGETPSQISQIAKEQVLKYKTVTFYEGTATQGIRTAKGFEITTQNGDTFKSRKLIIATGIFDIMPPIEGFAECWGISVLHCPYCHGYEVSHQPLGILGNGDIGFHLSRLLSNWTKDLTLYTNGEPSLTNEQLMTLNKNNIRIISKEIQSLQHENGYIQKIIFKDGSSEQPKAVFARVELRQHSDIPEKLGCELNEQGFLKVDEFGHTTVPGVLAAGDATAMFRAVSIAVAGGTKAGAVVNNEMIEEDF